MAQQTLNLFHNLEYVDEMYARYLADPQSVDGSWRALFSQGLPAGDGNGHGNGMNGAALAMKAVLPPVPQLATSTEGRLDQVHRLVNAYRMRGHTEAQLDPLRTAEQTPHPDLDPRSFGLSEADLDRLAPAGVLVGADELPLREVMRRLKLVYSRTIGVELMHISDPERRMWLLQRLEPTLNQPAVDKQLAMHIYDKLVSAELLERFVGVKFVGAKRFSIEGGETLIPAIHVALDRAGQYGVEECVLGMAHRGRLNVLINVMNKAPADLFSEFEDFDPETTLGGGDVKYHMGYSAEHTTFSGQKMHLSLAFNPSHLEAVDPVVVGRVRAKQRRRRDEKHEKVLGILIHGDAAFAGQGLVAETLNLSDVHGYRTGGTLHIIVNNQIGFTTSPRSSRSTLYSTDVAKMIEVPIFHVNGDDADAVAHVVQIAMDYRKRFRSDIVIDMVCFRRHGHNEADDPSFTQPLLYQKIRNHPTVPKIYAGKLIEKGIASHDEINAVVEKQTTHLDEQLTHSRSRKKRPLIDMLGGYWKGYHGGPDSSVPDVDTGVPADRLQTIGESICTVPDGFAAHTQIKKLNEERLKMARGEMGLNWAMGEALAFGSILWEGTFVRLSGQDSRRGTFSQRHAVFVDVNTGYEHFPLRSLHGKQGEFAVYDSTLSEAGVLGFEFGFSLDYPDGLVMWEAQFGDFVNGAQVILDQFVSSSEDKWKRLAGLVMLLPHGYEGQGPEHSSARFERFLQLAAEDNIQVCYPSTPAQYFHMLRRQVLRKWRKPLVVMTPKKLLRLAAARSELSELTTGRFQRVLIDPEISERENVRRIVLCTGKIYYDLVDARKKAKNGMETALVRVEQLYPLADGDVTRALDSYGQAEEIMWVQEEPANMGARNFILERLKALAGPRKVSSVSRFESASPATGSAKAHEIEQNDILERAFAPIDRLD